MRIGTFAIGVMVFLSGCDRLYGVQSRASLGGPVDISCINAAIHSVPDAARITYKTDWLDSVEILPKHRSVHTITHVWLYGEAQSSVLQIDQTPDGWDFVNSHSRIGEAIPQTEIDHFIPTMKKVNRAIQMRCGLQVADLPAEHIS
ncbi:hypothetical protein [Novosphingobium resinovorum]|jgi:hypothetical protein|uniref:Lipoprotein n=1 Tax=Novosphingobium resinovorum TaxID=158500 RepID=A0A1D8AFF8_9SPHN|nr:hypothetical protein [Novosphingobium resinovorum]AOR80854.1 hypothetical protein BES08_29080 [Novosphingobium resinovorum]